ncbi:3D domain-containing protein [Terrilactibacillus laevilacticus]|uniref:3D domain-containing protein n=1 Tax=Terrilactibacillus laevilacticus TaxID=1380157 RepID=A0ABW5PQL6_9BACI|nr:3D domain-containing protein [Terrilactibacillus laevilacticus]
MNRFFRFIMIAFVMVGSFLYPQLSKAEVNEHKFIQKQFSQNIDAIQNILQDEGYLIYPDTFGYAGPHTIKSIKAFQQDHHLFPAQEEKVMDMSLKNYPKAEEILDEHHKSIITKVQRKLSTLGYSNKLPSGHLDEETKKAISSFQAKNQLQDNGEVDLLTEITLFSHKAIPNHKAKQSKHVENKSTHPVSSKKPSQKKQTLTVKSTGYTANDPGCIGITKTGLNLKQNPNSKVIAVDPSIIPLGTKVYVPGYGTAIAADTGGGINGHHIDIFFNEKSDALHWGVKEITVTIL